ncbi:DUF1080 domain-containing protein [Seonamhaeicola sp.]|uniref:3-keto-disaccharide hydrolase n=1 Tax=Seonamhaeicola sp. TaxID=1912245 RepID=UPI00262F1EE7|nr:DUF1080 domain-containing protein [Seonamhaeicola sp.]
MKAQLKNAIFLLFVAVLVYTILSLSVCSERRTQLVQEDSRELFNGKDLDGWQGEAKWWTVENGQLVGATRSKRDPVDPSWLVTEQVYGDFELTLWCKLAGDGNRNSGVYYRGKWNADGQVIGYEFDLGGWAGDKELWWGELHDPYDRQLSVADLSKAETKALYNRKGWNHVRIRVQGNHIQHWLNGVKTVDWYESDPAIQKSGFIGFQIHPESKYEVILRDILLKDLNQ